MEREAPLQSSSEGSAPRSPWRRFLAWLSSLLDSQAASDDGVTKTLPIPAPLPESARETVSDGDKLLAERAGYLKSQYERNVRERITIDSIRTTGLRLFADGEWRLQPGFNLLLGRNGYGKSFLLRSVVALLKRDLKVSGDLVGKVAGNNGRLSLDVSRANSTSEEAIVRLAQEFQVDVGEVPVLAIPDSRFIDRSVTVLQAPVVETNLLHDGAKHFLEQLPYQGLVDEVLYELCLDYQESGLKAPAFEFLAGIVERLTGEAFQFAEIRRSSRLGFEMFVQTADSTQLPIQYASQGTLSVLAVFAIVRSFLKQLAEANGSRDPTQDEIRAMTATVFIDELDAHLHPVWQQQVRMLLSDSFPKVQFIVSSHSPLLVAGCGMGEVAVLRRTDTGYRPVIIEQDFIGATSAQLYKTVFEIDGDLDPTYLRYRTRLTTRDKVEERIAKLSEQRQSRKGLDEEGIAELDSLLRESQLLDRVDVISKEREAAEEYPQRRIWELEAEVERLQATLREKGSEGASNARRDA